MILTSRPSTKNIDSSTDATPLVLAQDLSQALAIDSMDWHRLKANRTARALELCSVAIVFLLKQQPDEALERLKLAVGWLDRSVSAPPCPTHGSSKPQ